MVPLASGFGIQVGMYSKLRESVRIKTKGTLVASGSSAAAGMVACCAHHLADGDVKHHEAGADQHARDKQHFQARPDERQQRTEGHHYAGAEQGPARAAASS